MNNFKTNFMVFVDFLQIIVFAIAIDFSDLISDQTCSALIISATISSKVHGFVISMSHF